MRDIVPTLRKIAGDTPDGISIMANVSRIRDAIEEIERLRAEVRDAESQRDEWRAIANQKQPSQG